MDIDDDHDVNPPFFPHKSSTNDFNNQIILTVIIALLFVVVLVLILYVYARCVLRRQASRRAGIIQQLGLAALVQSTEPPKTGLDPSVMAALPEFVFKQDATQDDLGTMECAVCLSVLVDGEMARLLPNCKHTFHVECIDKWLSSQPTCPICRTEAKPLPMLEPPTGNPPTAPPLEHVNSAFATMEGTSDGALQLSAKVSGSNSRLSSFPKMLSSRERSSRRTQSSGQDDGVEDVERQ